MRKALNRRDSPWSWPYFVSVSWGHTCTYCLGLGCICEGKRARATGRSNAGNLILSAAKWPKSLWILLDVAICTDCWFCLQITYDGFSAAHIILSFWKAALYKDISSTHLGSLCSTVASFQVQLVQTSHSSPPLSIEHNVIFSQSMRYGSFAPYRPTLVNRPPRGDCCYFSGRCFWFNEAFFFFTAGIISSQESEPPALATEVSLAPALVGSDLVPMSFLATFRPSDTFWCHYSVVCVCLSVCDCSVLLFLCRSSVHEPAESPGDHRRQPAETIWKLATQGEWVHVSQPLPVLLHCLTATRWHACTEYNRCLLHKEFNQIMPLIKPHELFSPTGYWSHIAPHRSYKQFAVLMVFIGCFTSCSKDFLQTLQGISLKLSVNLTATGGFFCC